MYHISSLARNCESVWTPDLRIRMHQDKNGTGLFRVPFFLQGLQRSSGAVKLAAFGVWRMS